MSAADLIAAASLHFGVSAVDIVGSRRFAVLIPPRAAVAYVLRERDGLSYPRIGRALGNRDHTTALHLVKNLCPELMDDPDFAAFVGEHIESTSTPPSPSLKLVPLPEGMAEPIELEEVTDGLGWKFTLDQHGRSREDRFDRRNTIRGSRLLAQALREARAA